MPSQARVNADIFLHQPLVWKEKQTLLRWSTLFFFCTGALIQLLNKACDEGAHTLELHRFCSTSFCKLLNSSAICMSRMTRSFPAMSTLSCLKMTLTLLPHSCAQLPCLVARITLFMSSSSHAFSSFHSLSYSAFAWKRFLSFFHQTSCAQVFSGICPKFLGVLKQGRQRSLSTVPIIFHLIFEQLNCSE